MIYQCKLALFSSSILAGGIVAGGMQVALAVDGMHLAHIALNAKQQQVAPSIPWISTMRLVTNADTGGFRLANGQEIMERPTLAFSYDNEARDVSRFYRQENPQMNMVLHYGGRHAGEVFSVGLDNGMKADKLTIKPAVFVGYARAFESKRQAFTSLSVGSWFGGKAKHRACVDAVGRQYYCPTLTAWSDFNQPNTKLQGYAHIIIGKRF